MRLAGFFLLACCAVAMPLPDAERARRFEQFRQSYATELDRLQKSIAKPNPTPTVRDLTNGALGVMALGRPSSQAESLLRMAFVLQDENGNLPWQMGHPEISDANSIEFACQAMGPLVLHYAPTLGATFVDELRPHLRAAFAAMRKHKVPVSYTNIFLMKTMNLALIGEAIGDDEAASEGYSMLDQWIEYTRQAGIHEFDSPTYYSVDLDSLMMGYRFSQRAEFRAKCKAILDYFWTDMAVNYFPGRQDLAGAHSRDYDFLAGYGRLLLHMHLEGLRDLPYRERPDMECVYMLENEVARGYRPDAAILARAEASERTVRSRWDMDPRRDRYTYLTPGFAIGSDNGDYNAQDKMIAVELASQKENFPAITVVPDDTDQPYGKLKSKDRSGHNKPKHFPLHPVIVQDRGTLTAVLNLEKLPENAATNIILPANADRIVLNGETLHAGQPFAKAAGPDAVVGIREGNGAVAIRIFHADGDKPEFVLKADREDLRWGAARYAVYHHANGKRTRVGLIMIAAKCANDNEFAALMQKARDARPSLDPTRPPENPPVLAVNGEDLSLTHFLGMK